MEISSDTSCQVRSVSWLGVRSVFVSKVSGYRGIFAVVEKVVVEFPRIYGKTAFCSFLPLQNYHLVLSAGPTKRRTGAHWTAWTRIEAHGCTPRRTDAHDGERTHSSRSGLQSRDAETLNWSEQEAFEDDSHQHDEERCRMDAHSGEWKCNQRMDTNCNAMQ